MIQDDGTIIETRSLAEQVYLHLCNSIIEGKFNYGETINIKHLAVELRVSPMPIREALKRMEVEGLVKLRDIIRTMKKLLEDGSFDIKKYIA